MNKLYMFLVASIGLMLAMIGTAHAAIDVTAVTTGFADLETAITTVGGLIISAAVVAVAFKWIKGMIFS